MTFLLSSKARVLLALLMWFGKYSYILRLLTFAHRDHISFVDSLGGPDIYFLIFTFAVVFFMFRQRIWSLVILFAISFLPYLMIVVQTWLHHDDPFIPKYYVWLDLYERGTISNISYQLIMGFLLLFSLLKGEKGKNLSIDNQL